MLAALATLAGGDERIVMMIQAMEAKRIEAASPIGDMDRSNRDSHRVVYQLTLLADTLALLNEESDVCEPAAKLAEAVAEQLEGRLRRVAFAFDDGTRIERVTDRERELLRCLAHPGRPNGKMSKVKQIKKRLGQSADEIHDTLGALERKGLIARPCFETGTYRLQLLAVER